MALKPCYWTDFSRGMYGVKNNHNTVVLCSLTREARSPFVLKHTTSVYVMMSSRHKKKGSNTRI